MAKSKNKIDKKTIFILAAVLVVCLIIGISVGKYLFKITHPNIEMLVNMMY